MLFRSTISTIRTPASMIQLLQGVELKYPIIAMDGAALYDIQEKEYKKVYIISKETTAEIREFLENRQFQAFILFPLLMQVLKLKMVTMYTKKVYKTTTSVKTKMVMTSLSVYGLDVFTYLIC